MAIFNTAMLVYQRVCSKLAVSDDLPMTEAGWCFVYVIVNLFQLHWVSLSVPVKSLKKRFLLRYLGVGSKPGENIPRFTQKSLMCQTQKKNPMNEAFLWTFYIPNFGRYSIYLDFINLKAFPGAQIERGRRVLWQQIPAVETPRDRFTMGLP